MHVLAQEYGQRPSDLIDPLWETLDLPGLRWQFDLSVMTAGLQWQAERAEAKEVEQARGDRPLLDLTDPTREQKPVWRPSDYRTPTEDEIDASWARFAMRFHDDPKFGRSLKA